MVFRLLKMKSAVTIATGCVAMVVCASFIGNFFFPIQKIADDVTPHTGSFTNRNYSKRIIARFNDTEVKFDKHSSRMPKANASVSPQTSLVLPVFLWSAGSSSLYNPYKRAIMFSLHNDYTIVSLPFHNHAQTQKGGLGVQRSFEETFDIDRLRKLLPVADLRTFREKCNSEIKPEDMIIPVTDGNSVNVENNTAITKYSKLKSLDRKYLLDFYGQTVDIYKQFLGIKLPKFQSVQNAQTARGECIGLLPSRELPLPKEASLSERVDKYWKFAPYVRKLAEELHDKLCMGDYAVMHWRNKTGERCSPLNPRHRSLCTDEVKNNLEILKTASPDIVHSVVNFILKNDISCLYVATPPYEQAIISLLNDTKRVKVHTISSLCAFSDRVRQHCDDNYVLSLLEQYIAEESALFIGTRTSNWSLFVESRRDSQHKKSVAVQELPGIPQKLLNMPETLEHII
ncbi:uncharacterized protein [Ptychodera flava]|uniref:uncharacterized protein isoform X2 n=1 Tax=Ptychodera flava TaxID=63121 RepID=UPI00396A60AE